ncbi:MAG: hypothetical protein WA117_02605 [Verrucomicrobiia bacterium]
MNLQSLVTVVLRVLSLYTGVSLFTTALPKAMTRAAYYDSYGWALLIGFAVTAVVLAAVVVLWKLATPIARMTTREVPQEVPVVSLSLPDGYSIAFVGTGIFFVGASLDRSIEWGCYYLKLAAQTAEPLIDQINATDFLYAFIQLAFGVALLVKGRLWAVKLARKHLNAEPPKPAAQ